MQKNLKIPKFPYHLTRNLNGILHIEFIHRENKGNTVTQKYGVKKKCAQVFGSLVWVSPLYFWLSETYLEKLWPKKRFFEKSQNFHIFGEFFIRNCSIVLDQIVKKHTKL